MKKSIYATFVEKGIENKIMYLHRKIVRIYNNLRTVLHEEESAKELGEGQKLFNNHYKTSYSC